MADKPVRGAKEGRMHRKHQDEVPNRAKQVTRMRER